VQLQRPMWWRRELLLLYASMTVARIGFGVMIILFPSYLARSSNVSLALVLALYPLTEAATAIPLGVLCDRQGRRRVFLGGLALMGGLIASVALTQDVLVVATLHALMGLAAAAVRRPLNGPQRLSSRCPSRRSPPQRRRPLPHPNRRPRPAARPRRRISRPFPCLRPERARRPRPAAAARRTFPPQGPSQPQLLHLPRPPRGAPSHPRRAPSVRPRRCCAPR